MYEKTPIYCHNCGYRMIPAIYYYDRSTRCRAWLCTHCGRLVRFVRLTNGRYLPATIWRGKTIVMRRRAI